MDGYSYYFWVREQFARCNLLSSAAEKEICKASVMAYAGRVGFTEQVLLMQALREPTVVRAEAPALPMIIALVIGAALLMGRK